MLVKIVPWMGEKASFLFFSLKNDHGPHRQNGARDLDFFPYWNDIIDSLWAKEDALRDG
jgi:hypothetical protein